MISSADADVHNQPSSSGILKALKYVPTPHCPDQQRATFFRQAAAAMCVGMTTFRNPLEDHGLAHSHGYLSWSGSLAYVEVQFGFTG